MKLIKVISNLIARINQGVALTVASLLASATARANTFDYSQVDSAATATGMGGLLSGWGNTILAGFVCLSICGFVWCGIELMFLDKEIRDVK